ncbi:MAG: hypothetical protein HYT07_01265 [Candidatus Levybacteria bacterium]|nr:hypothetical protein [Candidatus Levybacteria bacterium]
MKNNESKMNNWIFLAAIFCCGLPLLLLLGAGSAFALGISFLTDNLIFLILGLVFAFVFIWLFIKRRVGE